MVTLLSSHHTTQQRLIRADIIHRTHGLSTRACDEHEVLQVDAPLSYSRIWLGLYERFPSVFTRRLRTHAWLTETQHEDWIDDIVYSHRSLGVSTGGEIIETYPILGPTGLHWGWRVVGPHMPLSTDEVEALTALADRLAAEYPYEGDITLE